MNKRTDQQQPIARHALVQDLIEAYATDSETNPELYTGKSKVFKHFRTDERIGKANALDIAYHVARSHCLTTRGIKPDTQRDYTINQLADLILSAQPRQ